MTKELIIFGLILFVVSCDYTEQDNIPKSPIATVSNNTDELNDVLGGVLDGYYSMKNSFIEENDTLINMYATAMQQACDTLDLSTVKASVSEKEKDKGLVSDIEAGLKEIVGSRGVEIKRQAFRMVSDKLYELIKAVQYDRQIIYHEHCSMAFNEAGADWLSNTTEINNPYIPKIMKNCGEIKDTIDYTKP